MNIKVFQDYLKDDQAFFLRDPVNCRYATGFNGDDEAVLITKDKCYIIVDFRYITDAKKYQSDEIEVHMHEKNLEEYAKGLIKADIKQILIDDEYVTVSLFEYFKKYLGNYEYIRASNVIDSFRMIKQDYEIESIRKAGKISCDAFEYMLGFIKEGMSEVEIALELEFYMRKNQSEGIAFPIICVSGENSALPHGTPTDRKIQKGDFLTMDFGAKVNGYCFDITRTVAVGYATDEMKKVYDTVLLAQRKALENMKAGYNGAEIDAFARDVIAAAGYKDNFGHGLGHGVGMYIHERPRLSPSYKGVIKAGCVVTVEPGIYIEGKFGVRIEDSVLVTENGIENLTSAKKELIII